MDGSVPTIRIADEDVPGGRLINASDFDEKVHTKFEEPKAESKDSDGGTGDGEKTDAKGAKGKKAKE